MTTKKKRTGGISAAELMAQLSTDKGFVEKKRAVDAERQARVDELRRAEETIVQDLNEAGVTVSSVWDLVNTSEPYPGALPVLLAHLQRGGYPDRVMESLGRALAVEPASIFWESLRDQYLSARAPGEEEGLAVALSASATPDQLTGLIELLRDESRGDSRIHFLGAIKRVGGRQGREVLESLKSDDMFGREVRALLKSGR